MQENFPLEVMFCSRGLSWSGATGWFLGAEGEPTKTCSGSTELRRGSTVRIKDSGCGWRNKKRGRGDGTKRFISDALTSLFSTPCHEDWETLAHIALTCGAPLAEAIFSSAISLERRYRLFLLFLIGFFFVFFFFQFYVTHFFLEKRINGLNRAK